MNLNEPSRTFYLKTKEKKINRKNNKNRKTIETKLLSFYYGF